MLDKTLYGGVSGVWEHILKLIHYYNKLKSLKFETGESTLIWRVLEYLPCQFDVLRTSHNAQEAEWTIDEMISIMAQEEQSMRKGKSLVVQHVASSSGTKGAKRNRHKEKNQFDRKKVGKGEPVLDPKKKSFKDNSYKGSCKYCLQTSSYLQDSS